MNDGLGAQIDLTYNTNPLKIPVEMIVQFNESQTHWVWNLD
jgi:hypothetical protein